MLVFLFAIQNPQSDIGPAAGSSLWQLAFLSFAGVLILFEVLRGWRSGIARQLARLGALIAAYFAAYFGGGLMVPLVRPFLKMPDAILALLGGAILGLLVYAAISGLGTMLFRRTGQHESRFVRLLYGVSGAVLGILFGGFLVWLVVVGVRSLGAVANGQVAEQQVAQTNLAPGRPLHAVDARRRLSDDANAEPAPLMTTLARLKNSLELGRIGDAVKKADVVPAKAYDILGKAGKVASDPNGAQRFLSFPGARELSENPRIVALRQDPEIADLISQGRFLELLQNQKIRDAANDPSLILQVKRFDLQSALDQALKQE
jgi:colicin V production protein